jgi:hypothetical protein
VPQSRSNDFVEVAADAQMFDILGLPGNLYLLAGIFRFCLTCLLWFDLEHRPTTEVAAILSRIAALLRGTVKIPGLVEK